jgi:hypothetical protein
LFVPVIPVNVVPEWELRLIDESGQPVPNVRIDQSWKDYSLEFYSFGHIDKSLSSDEQGIVRFPARNILVSISQIIAAKIVDVLTSISPHASYGPHSHVYCLGEFSCSASYRPGKELPKIVIVKK